MKKNVKIPLLVMFLFCNFFIFADETTGKTQKAAIGIGPEWNMNARDNFAAGAVLAFDYSFGSSFAAGINVTASSNFSGITVLEPAALFCWYFPGSDHVGWFVQAEAGTYLVLEDGDVTPMFLGGIRAGLRLPLGSLFFIEPFGRFGYPFAFGVGCLAGVKF